MAERRMFSKQIIDSDAFLDMPLSAQALYFHLGMRADDDGFVNNAKKIQRMIGASEDDCKLLIAKRFILTFESGVIVIKHWRIHNYIQNDRYKETLYKEEKSKLVLTDKNAYTEAENCQCIQNGYKVDTQDRLGKDSIVKDIIKEKNIKRESPTFIAEFLDSIDNAELREAYSDFIDMRKEIKAPITTERMLNVLKNKLNGITQDTQKQIELLNEAIFNKWKSVYPIKPKSATQGKTEHNYGGFDLDSFEKKLNSD